MKRTEHGTLADWWSAEYSTQALSAPVIATVSELRQVLGLPRDEFFWADNSVRALRLSPLQYLEDAQSAIDSYRQDVEKQLDYSSGRAEAGAVLLKVFGLLQAFVLQQDATRLLWRSLDGPPRRWWSDFPDLEYIRRVRNATGGHPCDLKTGRRRTYHVVEEQRLSLRNVDLSHEGDDGSGGFGAIKPDCMIVEQSLSIQRILSDTMGLLTAGVTDSAVGWHRPWS